MPELARGSRVGHYPYIIETRLKQSAMSEVYLARCDQQGGIEVVLKVTLSSPEGSDTRDYIENEVTRLALLNHPGIVRLLPVAGTRANLARWPGKEGRWFLVMEHLSGDSLRTLLLPGRPLDTALALHIAYRLCDALAYLERRKMVHCDLKPDNVLFRRPLAAGRFPDPVLIDFGTACEIGQPGMVGGTPSWCSPERLRVLRKVSPPESAPLPHPSMDVWPLGMMLCWMLVGHHPYRLRRKETLTSAIMDRPPTPPRELQPNVSPEVNDLVVAMLARDPALRPTAGEVKARLELLLPPVSQIRVAEPRGNRTVNLPLAFTAALSVVMLGGGGYLATRPVAEPVIAAVRTALAPVWPRPGAPPPTAPTAAPDAATDDAATAFASVAANGVAATPSAMLYVGSPTPSASTPAVSSTPLVPTVAPSATPLPSPRPSRPPSPSPRPSPAQSNSVARVEPMPSYTTNEKVRFAWQPSFKLAENEAFEVIFYRAGEDPFVSGFGVSPLVRDNSVEVDLVKVDATPGHPLTPGDYLWGVRLVRNDQKVSVVGGGWPIYYKP